MTDIPGYVHGIVSLDPPMIRCDGCGRTDTGPTLALAVILSPIRFDHRDGFTRRLCPDCRHAAVNT